MTKEEIIKEAQEQVNYCTPMHVKDFVLGYIKGAEPREKRIEELKKENAKLKEAIKHFNPCSEWNDDVHDCEFRRYAMEYGSKLTKAKELLKGIIDTPMYYQMGGEIYESEEYKELISETEQFLKEIEQPKMSASQVPAPEPPKMEMVTESYNPLKFIKEEMKDNSSLIKESE